MAPSCSCVLSLGLSDPGGRKLFPGLQAWNRDMACLQSTVAGGLSGEHGCVWSPGTTKPHCGSEVLGSHPVSSSWPWLKSSLKSSVSSSPVLVYQPPEPSLYNPAGSPGQAVSKWARWHMDVLCLIEENKTKHHRQQQKPWGGGRGTWSVMQVESWGPAWDGNNVSTFLIGHSIL